MLALFDAEHRDWSLDEIAERTATPRMTAYRLTRTLRSEGYLVLDRSSGRYSLGPAMLTGLYLTEEYDELVSAARSYLEALSSETGESVTFAVEMHGRAVCADLVRSPRPGRLEIAVGRTVGDTANAHGKVFAAFSPALMRTRLRAPHEQRAPGTLTAAHDPELELERVRREDVAYDLEERDAGTCAVAAPVRDQMGAVVATVALVVPAGRFGPEARRRCTEAVRRTASALSSYLGYAAVTSASPGGQSA